MEQEILAKSLRQFVACKQGEYDGPISGRCDDLQEGAVYGFWAGTEDEATVELENHGGNPMSVPDAQRCVQALRKFLHSEVLLKTVGISRDAWLSSPEMVVSNYNLRYSENFFARYNKSIDNPPLGQQRESAWDCVAYHEYPCWAGTMRRSIQLLLLGNTHVVAVDLLEKAELRSPTSTVCVPCFKATLIKVNLGNAQRLEELFCWLPQPLVPPCLEAMHLQERATRNQVSAQIHR